MRTFRALVFAVLVLATTPLSAQVLLGPNISGVTVTNVTTTSALFTWTTDVPADSQVQYGANSNYGSSTPLDTAFVTSHSVTLAGLTQSTTYHFAVFSRNETGGLSNSPDATFATVNPNLPVISGVTASNITGTSALITWTTDTLTDSQVFYGLTSSYSSQSALNPSLTTSHSVTLAGLSDGKTYHYQVSSRDASLNSATSADATFNTPDTTPPVISGVTASSITSSGATITWTTDDSADTQVKYGLTTSYGSLTTLETSLGTSHSAALTGLIERSTYHYRVTSRNAAGILSTSTDYTFNTAIEGFVAGYAFAETVGLLTIDATDNAILGTIGPSASPPIHTAGKYGNALRFDGVDDSVTLANGAPLSAIPLKLTGSMTLSAWINASSFPNNESAVISKRSGGDIGYQLDISLENGQRKIGFRLTNDSGQPVVRYGATTLLANTWYHIAGVYDAAAQTMNVYLNGVLDNGTVTGTVTSSQQDSTGKVAFAKRMGVAGYEYAGLIDDVRMYNVPLTQAKIQLDMNVGLGGELDTVAPTISSVSIANITTNSATISWTTNELSNSQVVYGPSSAYGTFTTLDATLVTNHTVNLTGLSNTTTYHFSVVSKDQAGNQTQSGDATFATLSPGAPHISGITVTNITGTSAVITWATDAPADGQIEFGLTAIYDDESSVDTSPVTSHTIQLTGLIDGTTYHFRVLSKSDLGSLAASNDATFTTPDITPPPLNGVTVSAITSSAATITWSTNELADSQVAYGLTSSYGTMSTLNTTLEASHSVILYGLNNSTTYHYSVLSRDGAGNLAMGHDGTFTTVNPNAPHITGVNVASIATTGAVITWTTDAPADSVVEFGPTTSYGSLTTVDATPVLSHSVTLAGLTGKRLYHYRVKSSDALGNSVTSSDGTFITSVTAASGILANNRATDWSAVGAVIEADRIQCGPTIPPYTGDASTINDAIANCPEGHFVQLGAGTFNLSTGIELVQPNITLRGSGSSATILNITGITNTSCHIGQGHVMQMCTNNGTNIGLDSPERTANWTAGYDQGTTTVTLNHSNNLIVGSTIWFDQLDDTIDGYPSRGDVFMCDVETANCGNNGTGESYARPGRGVLEGHVVVSCSPTCNSGGSTEVTISPGIIFPAFRPGKAPGAWWGNPDTVLNNAGVEDLTLNVGPSGLFIINCTGCWVKNVRFLEPDDSNDGDTFHLFTVNAVNLTVQDNYFYGPPTTELVAIYQLAVHATTNSLFQNNIFHSASSSIVGNASFYGNVFSYNYVDAGLAASFILHGLGGMNLYEGNNVANFSGDTIHGPHEFETLFRNHHDGRSHNPSATETQAGVTLYSNNRFFNIVGNVIGDTHWNSYQTTEAHNANSIYELGWQGTGSGLTVPNDSNVARTMMRWGNYDSVNNAVRFEASEVPIGIQSFSNAVPASQALPNSFYLPAKPIWWVTPFGVSPWPAIGPDVTGGSLANSGGHAFKIPARLCFENTAVDPAYPTSNPRIKAFNGNACYASAPDVTSPAVSGVESLNVALTTATISWTTNEPADSQVEYGPTTTYGSTTTPDPNFVTAHSVSLTGLTSQTTYHYRVISKDSSGNLTTGVDATFTTLDGTPPVISGVTATGITTSASTIVWTTNEAADTQVEYGPTSNYGFSTTLNSAKVLSHSVVLSGLADLKTYHFRVKSKDGPGNLATSDDMTFTTSALPSPVISPLTATPPGLNLGAAPYFGGDFPLVVKGQNFVAGAVVSAGNSMLPATFVDSTELRVQVPSNLLSAPGMQDVKVVNPDGLESNVLTLRVVERGDINGNRSITIGDALACALTMGGITKPPLSATVGDLNLSGTINIGDCLTGALFAGRVNANFSVPKVTGVTPSVAVPGGQLTISGTGLAFDSVGDFTEVLFTAAGNGTVRVVPSSSSLGTSLTVTVPDNAVSGPIQVYRVDTPLGGNEFPLNVSGSTASLALTSVDPFYGVAAGSSVTLTGMGFDANPANNIVRFAAASGLVPGNVTAVGIGQSSLTVTVPSGAICGPVTVTTAGQTSNARTLAVAGSLCDLQLTDIWGGGAPGDTIVIEGAGFDVVTAANNIVRFTAAGGGTVVAPVLATGGTQLHVRIPTTAAEGPVSVQVGSAISNSISFTPSPHNE